MTADFDIVRIGALGDGIAETDEGLLYVPFALPGERVRLREGAEPELLSTPSPDRIRPVCRYFGTCGGCIAQHMSERLYADWKRDIIVDALRQHRLVADVASLIGIPSASRRRTVLTARHDPDGSVVLGYHRRKSNALIDVRECPILVPAIAEHLPALRAIAALLPKGEARLTVLQTRGGLDIAINHGTRRLSPGTIADFGRIAEEQRLARIAFNGETVIERAAPALSFAGADVIVPPDAFVQAAEPAEREITRIVLHALGRSRRVADLFCGAGTLTFPIARNSTVLAIDGDQAVIAALVAAASRTSGLKRIETRQRDLFREPLAPPELKSFDAVVFDPPRAGARAQAERLARSAVPLIVAVSCDPGTLARDLRLLVDGGYEIEAVTPVDQFVFSAHVEAVAVLRRGRSDHLRRA